jgi:hypothetical protein
MELTLDRLASKGWKGNLQDDLGDEFSVLAPRMPNPLNARYIEWKIWFEKIIPFIEEQAILIGHSLGGIFLTKYLSENEYAKKIKAVLLVAAPYNTPEHHPFVDFTITTPLDKFAKQAGDMIIYHSKDDNVVPFENAKRYYKDLPQSKLKIFTDRGHFNEEHFPEIVEEIKKINNTTSHY